ncbi:unnamed protein product [Bemisia tabaci]|uniref:Protein kinase domain-containing protein n=1 Tax=Bemisia tabaci TaxID=7038 RepID=A0A9P0AJ03_BEMTA|nr:unnamed protein product [Bemisia tabaci]
MAYRGLSRHVDIEGLPSPGNRFTLQELIGEGTYGEVFCALDTTTVELSLGKSDPSHRKDRRVPVVLQCNSIITAH